MSIRFNGKTLRMSGVRRVSANGHTIYGEREGGWPSGSSVRVNLISFRNNDGSLEYSNSLTLYDSNGNSLGTYNAVENGDQFADIPIYKAMRARSASAYYSIYNSGHSGMTSIEVIVNRVSGPSASKTAIWSGTSGSVSITGVTLDGTYNNFIRSVTR